MARIPYPEKPVLQGRTFAKPEISYDELDRNNQNTASYKAWNKYLYDAGEQYMRDPKIQQGSRWSQDPDSGEWGTVLQAPSNEFDNINTDNWVWFDNGWYDPQELEDAGWDRDDESGWVHKNERTNYGYQLDKWQTEASRVDRANALALGRADTIKTSAKSGATDEHTIVEEAVGDKKKVKLNAESK